MNPSGTILPSFASVFTQHKKVDTPWMLGLNKDPADVLALDLFTSHAVVIF